MDILTGIADVVTSLLAILGGLRVLARYTPWKWDDKLFVILESPAKWFRKG